MKRWRPDDFEFEMACLDGHQIQTEDVGVCSVLQEIQYHTQPLPNQDHRSKMPRMSEGTTETSGGAQNVLLLEGMPQPAPRPRGPKMKFTPENDGLLVDLKENRSLTYIYISGNKSQSFSRAGLQAHCRCDTVRS